ncbi:hypothetical protein [Candidatus Nitrospira salsa]
MKQLLAIAIALLLMTSGQSLVMADSQGSLEVTLQLRSLNNTRSLKSAEEQASALQHVTIMTHRRVQGAPPKQRNPELSEQQLVVVALNVQGEEVTRVLIPDPRMIRAETVEPTGEIESRLFLKASGEYTIVLPNDSDIYSLKIFHPTWTGTEFVLEPLGETYVP